MANQSATADGCMLQAFEELVVKILETPGIDEKTAENGAVDVKDGKPAAAGACSC